MIGNDDCGQMSAWYILACLGFYPVNPANGEFVLGAPQLKKAVLQLAGGKTLHLNAPRLSEKRYFAKSAHLNGRLLSNRILGFSEIMGGGELIFDMEER